MQNQKKQGDFLIAGRYKVKNRIGKGSFGEVHEGEDVETGGLVAMKFERTSEPDRLQYELAVYKAVKGTKGFPKVLWQGSTRQYRIMVMDRLGPSVHDYYTDKLGGPRNCGLKFVLEVAKQVLSRLETLHDAGFIHRDLKPQNVVFCNEIKTVNMIDFGSSRSYLHHNGGHKEHAQGSRVVGSRRYSCLDNHYGMSPCRRDDLESFGYVVVYMSTARLPWQGIDGRDTKEKWRRVRDVKKETTIEVLCEHADPVFYKYMQYVSGLKFDARPDYEYLRGLFQERLDKL